MGEVYLADDTQLGRKVALKFLSTRLADDPDFRARITREAQAAALSVAHGAGVTHRDIKPGNVVIDQSGRVRLLDFGLAKVAGAPMLTKAGSTVGTMSYMSPEQAAGRDATTRSDVFSLGVVMYELFTGRRPFVGEYDAAIVYALMNENPATPKSLRADIPERVERIILRALTKDPNARYPDATALLSELKTCVERSAVGLSAKAADRDARITVAVLPFSSSGDAQREDLADGLSDEVGSALSAAPGLRVIAYASSRFYRPGQQRPRYIAAELGATHLVEGALRWNPPDAPGGVRVNIKLIAAADESYVWSEAMTRVAAQLVSIPSDAAQKIGAALGLSWKGDSHDGRTARTRSMEAYEAYLRAKDLFPGRFASEDHRRAKELFEKALELDPGFANAHALYTALLSFWYFAGQSRTPETKTNAKLHAERAMEFEPNSGWAWAARGFYNYYCELRYSESQEDFLKALALNPNDELTTFALGFVERRLGLWSASVDRVERGLALHPRSILGLFQHAVTMLYLRRYDDAERLLERTLWISPDHNLAKVSRGLGMLLRGDLESAKTALQDMTGSFVSLEDFGSGALGAAMIVDLYWVLPLVFEGDVERTFRILPTDPAEFIHLNLAKAIICCAVGRKERAAAYADSVTIPLRQRFEKDKGFLGSAIFLTTALSIAGESAEAIAVGEKVVREWPRSRDAVEAARALANLAFVYALAGEKERACATLADALSRPSPTSPELLRLSPFFASLRDDPRFVAALETEMRYE